ncbi:LysR family transcriptional regulator [Cognatishimia maritima]|uniref:DNA-binding transcriptional regulator, LysR family n=1 Tax=Cognatishimia maritima TaxID=870908 RepID=A0A1M5W047_9RHOB|nr:LysR family transcriptional regulator [Cognatishimia maritima]SHH80875.1 DNA-binding transcriptional regulator, LysR family [Cognatishimia maritima]
MEHKTNHQMSKLDWDDLRFFLAVCRKQTVRAAADSLKVSVSTVSRRIENLERALAAKVFERKPKGLELSPIGESLRIRADQIESQVLGIEREVLGKDLELEGEIKVSVPAPILQELLMDDVVEFGRRYPKISLSVDTSYSFANLERREADIVVRFSATPGDTLVGRRLPDFADAIYATPSYIESHTFEGDFPTAKWIGWGDAEDRPVWVRESQFPRCGTIWSIVDPILQTRAAEAGLGFAVLPCMLGDRRPGLRRVVPEVIQNKTGWILTHPDLRTTARVRVFANFLYEAIRDKKDLVTGASYSDRA